MGSAAISGGKVRISENRGAGLADFRPASGFHDKSVMGNRLAWHARCMDMNKNPSHIAPSNPATPMDAGNVVADLSAELAGGSDLEQLLERFLVSIIALAGAQAGAVRVLTDDGKHLRLVGQLGLPPNVLMSRAPGGTQLRHVWHRREQRRAGLGRRCPVLCPPWVGRLFWPAVPSRAGDLAASRRRGAWGSTTCFLNPTRPFAPQTEAILRLIGQLLGLTLHNARIERERLRLTVMRERQEMVNEVHDALAQTLAYVKMRLAPAERCDAGARRPAFDQVFLGRQEGRG